MKRREVLIGTGLIAGLAALRAFGQPAARKHRVVALLSVPEAYSAPYWAALKQRLAAHGFVEGQNLTIDAGVTSQGFTYDVERLSKVLATKPDAVFAMTTGLAHVALGQSRSTPIVFTWVPDPVGSALVKDYARPGANATGVSSRFYEVAVKRLELLRELLPLAKRIALAGPMYSRDVETAAARLREVSGSLGFTLEEVNTGASVEISAIEAAIRRGAQAALPLKVYTAIGQQITGELLVRASAEQRFPVIFAESELVDAGGLISYGTSLLDEVRRAADMLAQVLRGAKPAEVPVDQASRFELVVNLKTARRLGLRIPQSVLVRADRVIE